jgi:general secretion pathway protein M
VKLPPAWSAAWQRMAPRERLMLAVAAGLVLFALFWWTLVAPALAVLRNADAQHRALDDQLARMRALQQQAQALQAQPKQGFDESMRQLEAAVRDRLGTNARIAIAGERVTLTLTGVPADALAAWMTQARVNARALPAEARLTRNAAGQWDGTVVVTLPAR